jgi:hypothetical protein
MSGYEPILEVQIEGDSVTAETTPLGMQAKLEDPADEADIRVLADGEAREQLERQIKQDPKLRWALSTVTYQAGARVPTFDVLAKSIPLSSTQTIRQHPIQEELSEKNERAGLIIADYLMRRHEIGTREQHGGHFASSVDPETFVMGEHLPRSDVWSVLYGNSASTRAHPRHFHEVRAMLEHRRAARTTGSARSIFSDLLAQVDDGGRNELRAVIKEASIDTLSDALDSWETKIRETEKDSFSQIADFLENKLGIDRALDLLAVPQEAVMNPNKWLCHLLHDVAEGREPDKIRHNGSFWETANHDNPLYEVVAEETARRRKAMKSDPFRRVQQSLHTVVTFENNKKVRRWYAYRPSDESVDAKQLRFNLLCREIYTQLDRAGHVPLNDGVTPATLVTENGRHRFNVSGHQKAGVDPYKRAMSGEATVADIGRYFEYDVDKQLSFRMWNRGRQQLVETFHLNNVGELVEWLKGDL